MWGIKVEPSFPPFQTKQIKGEQFMLSVEQQNTIENSIWVVNTALKNQGLSADEDMRQDAILYMCKCIQRFDPSRNIKWTTYAYRNVYLYIKLKHKRQMAKLSYQTCREDIYTAQPAEMPIEEEEIIDEKKMLVEQIRSLCNAKERQVIDLTLQGYSRSEIGQIMGRSVAQVKAYKRSIKDKAREQARCL